MCGRFTLRTPLNRLVEQFQFRFLDDSLRPRYNIAPSQSVAVLRPGDDAPRQLSLLRWGLIPSWAKDPRIGYKMINARAETVDQKPSFRAAFQQRRCLVLADGYYEWRKTAGGSRKQPYYIHLRGHQPFAFAGLWESRRQDDASSLETCSGIL